MLKTNWKKWWKVSIAAAITAGVIALPVVTTINYNRNPSGFSPENIGIYAQSNWVPVFEKAIEEYNKLSDDQTPIQILETTNPTESINLMETLGYRDQVMADLLYIPIDKVPAFAERHKALVPFQSPEELYDARYYDSSIWKDDPALLENLSNRGMANITTTNSDGEKVTEPKWFGVIHNVEALLMFTKGDFRNEVDYPTFQSIVDATNWDTEDIMYSAEFFDLWYGIGVISAFFDTTDGTIVGDALSSVNLDWKEGMPMEEKYYSALTTIHPNVTEQQYYEQLALKTQRPELANASQLLSDTIEWIFGVYNKAAATPIGDWLVKDPGAWYNKFKEATHSATVGGLWFSAIMKDLVSNDGNGPEDGSPLEVKVRSIPPPNENTGEYKQGVGGWVYAINRRNFGDEKRIEDMQEFLNVLFTDPTVIHEHYTEMGMIPAGGKAEEYFGSIQPTADGEISRFDKEIIQAVFDTVNVNVLDLRPDSGNPAFEQAWTSWKETGLASSSVKNVYSNGTSDEAKISEIKRLMKLSFENAIERLIGEV